LFQSPPGIGYWQDPEEKKHSLLTRRSFFVRKKWVKVEFEDIIENLILNLRL
jgi:hypothetical protein